MVDLIICALSSARGGPEEVGQAPVSPSSSLHCSFPLPGVQLHYPTDEQDSRFGEGGGVDTGESEVDEMEKDIVG